MAVPTVLTDLTVSEATNGPPDSESVTPATRPSDYLRAHAAFIRRMRAQGAALASAATVNIGAITDGEYIHITGVATINAFDVVAAGVERTLVFDGVLTLTHNATTLILPGGVNIVTAAGNMLVFVSEGSGNWRLKSRSNAAAAGANADITSLTGLSTPLSIAQGGTSATTAAAARAALGAAAIGAFAAAGANSDITTLSAVTLVSNTGAQLQLANNTQINCTNVAGSAQVPVLAGNASVAAHLIALGQTLSDLSAGSGYIKLPVWTGAALRTLIIQYATGASSGSIVGGGNASQTITFPIPFPVQCSFVLPGQTAGTPVLLTTNIISSIAASCVVNVSNPSGNTYASTPRIIAFGY